VSRQKGVGPGIASTIFEARSVVQSQKHRSFSASPNSVQAHFSVSDGRTTVGTVQVIDGAFVATDINGKFFGTFSSLRAAARALHPPGGAP
jgi:hypothetical protein